MSNPTTENSTKFPPGYGDFALECSDAIVCYFPRYLLEYMSPVFKDMFSISVEGLGCDSVHEAAQPLPLTERSQVIESLLEHIDPKSKRILPMHPDTIFELLEAARKYQISTIIEWFEDQAGRSQPTYGFQDEPIFSAPLTSTHPQLALKCAFRFDFPRIGKLALRELAGSPSAEIEPETTELSSRVYSYQCQLRRERVERYQGYISRLSNDLKFRSFTNNKLCSTCLSHLTEWFLHVERSVVDSPRWASFSKPYESKAGCNGKGCEGQAWVSHLVLKALVWKDEALQMEGKLPEWPF